MTKPYYEVFREINELGIHMAYNTIPGGYHPLHWHEELEILFPLNGEADVTMDGKTYHLRRRQVLVIESGQLHSTDTYSDTFMFVCIHISKRLLEKYSVDTGLYHLRCVPDEINDGQFPEYLKICQMAEDLTRLYIEEVPAAILESDGIILQILAHLLRFFSVSPAFSLTGFDTLSRKRLRLVISYVEEHFREPVSLLDAAGLLGFNKEYFCRFFKKRMGLSFLQYVNEVRITHIYQDLQNTDKPIAEIMEANGFTNQKLFNRIFKEMYQCTPSAVRKK